MLNNTKVLLFTFNSGAGNVLLGLPHAVWDIVTWFVGFVIPEITGEFSTQKWNINLLLT